MPDRGSPQDLHVSSKASGHPATHCGCTRPHDLQEHPVFSLIADRRDIAAGARAMLPWLVGVVPFGLVIGLSAAQASIPTLAGWLTGPLIYSGSAQVAVIQMLDGGAAPLVVILAALVINLRLVLYSAAMARHWRGSPWWWRLVAGYLLVDPSFAVGLDGYDRPTNRGRALAPLLRRRDPVVGGVAGRDRHRRRGRRRSARLAAARVRDPALPGR